ncbi:MAG: SCO family protein [Chloroflexi bacterium]|nr:SCO family protein [Chloroflexota bacterium]
MRVVNRTLRICFVSGLLLFMLLFSLMPEKPAWAHDPTQQPVDILKAIGFDQHLDAQVPLDTEFVDADGQRVPLSSYFQGKPVIMLLGYFECPNLCPLEREGLVHALQPLKFTVGKDFDVVMITIDPKETPAIATKVKQQSITTYARPGTEAGWHFLTGEHAAIDRVAKAVGFRYAYDVGQQEYAHPSGVIILTPAGKIARYLFGIEYAPFDLRLGLVEAAASKIGTPVDQFLLLCFHYNPNTGTYSLLIMNMMRLAGVATTITLGLFIWMMHRREAIPGPAPTAASSARH